MAIVVVARKPGEEWGVLSLFTGSDDDQSPFRTAQQWRDHLPHDEIRVAKIPYGDCANGKIYLHNMEFVGVKLAIAA